MIRFENDDRTRGELFVLRTVLQGLPLPMSDWELLRADDFFPRPPRAHFPPRRSPVRTRDNARRGGGV